MGEYIPDPLVRVDLWESIYEIHCNSVEEYIPDPLARVTLWKSIYQIHL